MENATPHPPSEHVGPNINASTQPAPVPVIAIAPKSAGLAAFLTFLWLGAGHLYVNRTGAGIGLIVIDVFLWLLSWTIVGWFLAFPIWLLMFIVAAMDAAQHANNSNQRLLAPSGTR